MNLVRRAAIGSLLTLVTAGLIGTAGWRLHTAISGATDQYRPSARERSYAVDVGTLTSTNTVPTTVAYGQVQSWNSLEIRAPAGGTITEISKNLRDGLNVGIGELLFRIDPEQATRRVIDATAGLSQAKFEQSEATLTLTHVEAELEGLKSQISVRESDLTRKKKLLARKLTTSTIVDDAVLALASARQSELSQLQAVLAAKARIDKAKAGVERAELALKDAKQTLLETSYRVPFAGQLADVSATLGRRISANEKLATLIDPGSLEVVFQMRNSDFGNLVGADNKLRRLPVKVTLDLADKAVTLSGRLDRTAALASSQTGRTIYAKLNADEATVLRPGDFVTVEVTEPKMTGISVIPTAAASADGRILLVNDDGRLAEHPTTILRRQGDNLIVRDVPLGKQFVRLRLPFLAAGIKVRPRNVDQPAAFASTENTSSGGSEEDVAIDDTKRAALIEMVKASARMPEDRRAQVLAELAKPKPPRSLVERLERRLARRNRS